MPLQTTDLVMVALGVLDDTKPPNPEQPSSLADGIHLRWSFARAKGFPWHGYYLFRRDHAQITGDGDGDCLSAVTKELQKGLWPRKSMTTHFGNVSSDANLVLTRAFNSSPSVEFDLDGNQNGRTHLRFDFPKGQPARFVSATIGFRPSADEIPTVRKCVSFGAASEEVGPNPRNEPVAGFGQPVTFAVKDASGNLAANTKIESVDFDTEVLSALKCGGSLEITLPCASTVVDLVISQTSRPASITAFNQDGSPPRTVFPQVAQQSRVPVRLTGPAINRILIQTYAGATRLHDICFVCAPITTGPATDINVTFLSMGVPVSRRTVTGLPGDMRKVQFEFDLITAIEFTRGRAVLIDLCFIPVAQAATMDWERIEARPTTGGSGKRSFEYPMCLPVAHRDYPCANAPADEERARALATERIIYGSQGDWSPQSLTELHETLSFLVAGGPTGTSMAKKVVPEILADFDLEDLSESPKMTDESPLDTVLMASLNPAFAQMIGLYWADDTAQESKAYDYLIVADYDGSFHPFPDPPGSGVSIGDFDRVDAYIVFNVKSERATPLPAPGGVRSYSLPGAGALSGPAVLRDATNNAGLLWDLRLTEGTLLPGAPCMYHVWRADVSIDEPASPPGSYRRITEDDPVVVTADLPPEIDQVLFNPSFTGPFIRFDFVALGPLGPERSSDWPPFRLFFIDSSLLDGWYSYQVCSIDIFGRYSPRSLPATWFQWQPEPKPLPWYYQLPAADKPIHDFAVHLLDKNPPPPPTAIEAWALDPADPLLVKDDAYNRWLQALTDATWYEALTDEEKNNLIGLRVRWQWTEAHKRQAPDTKEFRIYYHPDQMNALIGRSLNVSAAAGADSAIKSVISTDIANNLPGNSYQGLWIQVGEDAFPIDSSEAGSPLRLTVMNIGTDKNVAPRAGQSCTIAIPYGDPRFAIPDGHPRFLDYSASANWAERLHVVAYDDNLFTPEKDDAGNEIAGNEANITVFRSDVATVISLDANSDLGNVKRTVENRIDFLYLYLENDTDSLDKLYRIIGVDDAGKIVTVAGFAKLSSEPSPWIIGQRVHKYEVFLPDPSGPVHTGLPMGTTLDDPIKYAHIGVSAADDKTHTNDNVKWASGPWGSRSGNEGRVGAPAKIFRVRRELPLAPESVDDRDKALATRADYHSRSFYTFRWKAVDNLRTHIYRALDDSVFKTDWLIRTTRTSLNPQLPQHAGYFPKEDPDGTKWDLLRKQSAAAKLNTITSEDRYKDIALTTDIDAQRVLARLPGNEGFVWDSGSQEHDWQIRSSRVDLSAADDQLFPGGWGIQARGPVANELAVVPIMSGATATLTDKTIGLDGTPDLTRVIPHRDTIWLEGNPPPESPSSFRRYSIVGVDVNARTVTLDEAPDISARTYAWAIHVDEYGSLSDRALRVLAGLPGNESAFSQITNQPLDPDDPANFDRRGPDDLGDRVNYVPDSELRAYLDALDGRSTNRYLYRAAYFDGANNSGTLGLPSPPVYLPKVVPPRAPVITNVFAGDPDPNLPGDKKITLMWVSNPEPDLKEYRIYRADSADAARDLRLMTRVHIETVLPGPPVARPETLIWTDESVAGRVNYFYRAVAEDLDGNVSLPSPLVSGRAFDDSRLAPPAWNSPSVGDLPHIIVLSWTSQIIDLACVVQRRQGPGEDWVDVSGWLARGNYTFTDSDRLPATTYDYRLRVLDNRGRQNNSFDVLTT